ncbi:peptidase M23 [Pseudidiomarina homiensis]|uniref:Peptidase M23 n=2 Tax=Pseudidiomarina homiensis TaxID=364198 RepID=A0A432Y6R6_9GAMM|nr:peptidase M23 [Pseudidiomarina homiensis]
MRVGFGPTWRKKRVNLTVVHQRFLSRMALELKELGYRMRRLLIALGFTVAYLQLGCSDAPTEVSVDEATETQQEPAQAKQQGDTPYVLQPTERAKATLDVDHTRPLAKDSVTAERSFTPMSNEAHWVTLKSGQTVSSLLSKQGFSSQQIANLAIALRKVVPLNKLQAGSIIAIDEVAGQRQVSLAGEYAIRVDALLRGDDWQVTKTKVPTRIEVAEHAIVINHSLYGDGAAAGIPGDVINSALLALSHFIDFQRQVYSGNRFEVVFERTLVTEDEALFAHQQTPLKPTYLRFKNSDDDLRLYRYNDAFYLEDGRLAESFLLKTPLNGARLSSHYGQRKHPLLGYTRMHKGIDFSAPAGTPIMAAGNATVKRADWYSTYGNAVVLQHDDGYETLYAHLKGFASDIKPGVKVKQGQVIGFLGNTGLSQARHLHYEVYKNGKSVNPLNLKKLTTERLAGQELAQFIAFVEGLEDRTMRLAQFASGDSAIYLPPLTAEAR